ncbi:MAG: type II toxin-antitoxin system PemK/MazF family toxin, partial [Longimicrobiales bacterium]|nr:type II toxin-antitoxin system PemK/MazF family toxin [Longimicrobiales bacterium]
MARWELYWVDLEPRVGSEQGGERRPALVVSNDGFNHHFDVVTILPLTKREGKERRIYAFELLLGSEEE